VVDELGGEDQRTGEALSDLIEQRGDEQRRTVITTNLEPRRARDDDSPGFLERYGDRLVSRLRAGGVTGKGGARWAVKIGGSDLRGADLPAIDEVPAPEEARPASLEFMTRELADKAPEVAAMLQPAVEAQRAAGRDG
jgi:hypothetical protein